MDIGLDFDGTLVTCKDRHVALMRASARKLGVPLDADAYWQSKREGRGNPAALAATGVDRNTADALCALWARDIERLPWLWFDQPINGIEQALRTLVAKGRRLHVLTARRCAAHLWLQLERSRLSGFMTSVTVIEQRNVPEQKAAALAAKRCSLYIGDTESDHEAAHRAGVRFGAVASGMRSESFLRARGVRAIRPTLVEYIHELVYP